MSGRNVLSVTNSAVTNALPTIEGVSSQAQTAAQPHQEQPTNLDSGQVANGILEVLADGYGFIRSDNYLPGENDIYINPALIRRYNLKTGDILCGNIKVRAQTEKFAALLYLKTVNGLRPEEAARRRNFEDLTPIFPNQRVHLERPAEAPPCGLSTDFPHREGTARHDRVSAESR